jgi:MerR family transcriptional regulator, heat shock protein HspR
MAWPQSDRGVFAISVAADLAGLHPQTLRIYEREGLLQPARSEGGTRRYSGDDVERLRLIGTLTSAGINLAGVKRVLALEAELEALRATIEQLGIELEQSRKRHRDR